MCGSSDVYASIFGEEEPNYVVHKQEDEAERSLSRIESVSWKIRIILVLLVEIVGQKAVA